MIRKTLSLLLLLAIQVLTAQAANLFADGRLTVSANHRFLQYENGKPFFWLGDTGWLLPERLNRDEASYYLDRCAQAGFNVVQVQVINGIPGYNIPQFGIRNYKNSL